MPAALPWSGDWLVGMQRGVRPSLEHTEPETRVLQEIPAGYVSDAGGKSSGVSS